MGSMSGVLLLESPALSASCLCLSVADSIALFEIHINALQRGRCLLITATKAPRKTSTYYFTIFVK